MPNFIDAELEIKMGESLKKFFLKAAALKDMTTEEREAAIARHTIYPSGNSTQLSPLNQESKNEVTA